MRHAWWIVGGVVVAGAVVYLTAMDRGAVGSPALERSDGRAPAPAPLPEDRRAAPAPAPAPAPSPPPRVDGSTGGDPVLEARAKEILDRIAAAGQARDRARYDAAFAELREAAWDADAARRYAVQRGWAAIEEARAAAGAERVARLDEARRLLSRGVWLLDLFDADGRSTDQRRKLLGAIQAANNEVMTYDRRMGGGVRGVTRAYQVPPGVAPVQIVSRERLPYGHNALLWWNHAGDLNPRRLRAAEILLLPEEELHLEVSVARRLLAVWIGDWFVKEFDVGVGRDDRPTPLGEFAVGPKEENPDWWSPNGFVPYGHPDNELGSVWIPITNATHDRTAGYGIHGTNRQETVGTRCSNGCVRLANQQASELFWWVRTGGQQGRATAVHIR
jgi:hypothetical protein